MTTEHDTKPANAPTHFAFIPVEYKSGREIKTDWGGKVGVLFPHKDGKGWTLRIRPGLALIGDVTIREPLPENEDEQPDEDGVLPPPTDEQQ